MNYDDELERAQAKKSRKRESNTSSHGSTKSTRSTSHSSVDGNLNLHVEAGSRASKNRSAGSTYRRKKKKNNKTKKIIIGVLIAIVAVVIAVAVGVFGYFNDKLKDSQSKIEVKQEELINENIPVEVREKMEQGFWTVAVFGVDSRDNSLGKGNQSDVIMIANLNRETGEIKLVSVFRDTYLNINEKNTYNKINAAYASGGPEAAIKALNKNLDLNITHYATFNWKAVATVINILGGVEIDISPSEFYYINAFITETVKGTGIGSTQLTSAGVHNLDGVQAVAYGRLRLMDSDYARTERQRIVIQKAFEKVKTANLSTLNDVVGHVFEMSATNIGFEDLAGLVKNVSKYHMGETTGFPAARGEARIKIGSDSLSCVIPQTLESNVISLHNFLYGEEDYTPSSTVKEISAKIASVTGLATEAEEIGHVAVDKGYIPKATTAAATTAATTKGNSESTEETLEDESTEETSEGESESGEGESGSISESESESEVESSSALNPGNLTGPSAGPGFEITGTTASSEGPKSPADMTTAAPTEGYGPGTGRVPEATTGASSGPGSTTTSGGNSSVTITPSTSATPGTSTTTPGGTTTSGSTTTTPGGTTTTTTPGGTTTSTSTSGPSSTTSPSTTEANISSGTISGPASQATTVAQSPGA